MNEKTFEQVQIWARSHGVDVDRMTDGQGVESFRITWLESIDPDKPGRAVEFFPSVQAAVDAIADTFGLMRTVVA